MPVVIFLGIPRFWKKLLFSDSLLEITDAAEDLAAALVKVGTIPETHSEDALHIALAVINGVDFLVTWNFHHINNAKMIKGITKVAEENGYECPVICSPEELEGE